jgi:hypothetical protein
MEIVGIFYCHLVYLYCGHLVHIFCGHLVYLVCGHLVCFGVIWYILWSFGMFCGHLVYFPPLWCALPRKKLATLQSNSVLNELFLKHRLNLNKIVMMFTKKFDRTIF